MAAYVGIVEESKAVAAWREASAVCFDVDSTLCTDEGIDQLATLCGVGDEVAAWTAKAMGGNVTFQESLAARLGIMKPKLAQVEEKIAREPAALTPGITDLVKLLHKLGKKVYLVSGGFHRMILPAANILNIPEDNIYANKLIFDADGNYTGFDDTCMTCRSGGKPKVVEHLKTLPGHESIVMIGDGATDMEARPPASLFIGFGGNKVRDKVKAGADWFVMDFADLIAPLEAQ